MRYIPDVGNKFILQVPEDKNSYINVKSNNARGIGTTFYGKVTNINGPNFSIGDITDGSSGTLQQYFSDLSTGIELQVYTYKSVGNTPDSPIITVLGSSALGIDFSTTSVSSSDQLKQLKYYIFGYNVDTGKMPNAVQVIGGANNGTYSKVLDPNFWNSDQYFEITFSRAGANILPVIYRVWGTRVEFLGVIGNDKIGFPGSSSTSFKDFGLTEIPSWNNEPLEWTPDFMSGLIQIQGGVPIMQKKIVGREHLKINPRPSNSVPNFLECSPATQAAALVNTGEYTYGDEVRFIIDDTKPIRQCISIAALGNIKELFFPSGTYYFRDSFFINSNDIDYSNLSFRGAGEGSILKRIPSSITSNTSPGLLSFVGQSESPRISGLRFNSLVLDGNKRSNFSLATPPQNRASNEDLLSFRFVDSLSVGESRFINSFGSGVYSFDSNGIVLTNSTFSKLGRSYEKEISPIFISNSENAVIQGNIFEFSTKGPYLFSTDFSTVNNNIVRSCGDSGIVLESSYQWNATSNLAYSDSDSLIRSVDQYNNEYSKAVIEILRGTALEPIYFTVTNGGESVGIFKDTIDADIYSLTSTGAKSSQKFGSFKVLQTSDQLEAGIFSLTLPGNTAAGLIPPTANFSILNPSDNKFGYMYEVNGTVKLGMGGKGYVPVSIRTLTKGGVSYLAIKLKNSSDLLSFQIYSASSTENDKILISGFKNTNLSGWDVDQSYPVVDIDIDTNSLLINAISALSPGAEGVQFLGGRLYIVRSNYQIANGNIIVN